jgi:hypothetical protein
MTVGFLLVFCGVILFAIGIQLLRTAKNKPLGNDELEWAGFGEHPFRRK